MKLILFIFLFLFIQEPVKKKTNDVKADTVKLDIEKAYQLQNMKLDSIIAAKKIYNQPDTAKIKKK